MASKNYSYDMQKLFLEMFLANPESYTRCQNIFTHIYFEKSLREVARFIKKYADEYKALPDPKQIQANCHVELIPTTGLQDEHYDWLIDEFESFCRHKALEKAILESADLLEKGEYGTVEEKIRTATQIGLTRDLGINYFDDPRTRLLSIKDNNGQVSTGWQNLDRKLYGGFNRGELNVFVGGSGAGKSLFLQNISLSWALAGLNVVYFTFELSKELTAMRIDSMLTGVSSKEIFKNIDDIELKVKMAGKKAGVIQIKEFPAQSTCNDLKAYLKEFQIQREMKPDALVVDYLDLMLPNNKRVSPSDLFIKDKYVSEELRNLAKENRYLLSTASQLNRCLTLDTIVIRNNQPIVIKDVRVGDQLKSSEGDVKVLNVFPITKQPIYEITTRSGKKIKVSARHLFPTANGLRNLKNGLCVGEKLYIESMDTEAKSGNTHIEGSST